MVRNRNQPSSVRGPNSALTEFLQSRGISAATIRQRARAVAAAAVAEEEEEEANEAISQEALDAAENVGPRTRSQAVEITMGLRSGHLLDPDTSATVQSFAEKKNRSRKRKRPNRRINDSDSEATSELPKNKTKAPGQIEFCTSCDCRFTVTAYSRPGPGGEGLLCTACGADGAKADKAAKRNVAQRRRVKKSTTKQLLDGKIGGPKSLRELCINLVAKYIDDVEALGDIGTMNMDLICKIIARNRRLNNHTFKLFLDPGSTRLNVYDCSKIETTELKMIASVVPTLKHLSLSFCGLLTDEVVDYYAEKLLALNSFYIDGPFLVTKDCYSRFFKSVGSRLERFVVRDTARIDKDVINSLVENCPNLVELRLGGLSQIQDECLALLKGLKKLEILEISQPSMSVTDAAIVDLLNHVGSGLEELNLAGCVLLTNSVVECIHACCGRLTVLCLDDCEMITGDGLYNLFTNWPKNFGLTHLSLSNLYEFNDRALCAVLDHSGNSLEVLNLNSCVEITRHGLDILVWKIQSMARLEEVDLGFIRAVDDVIVEGIVKGQEVKLVKVWGNPSVSEACAIPRGTLVVGRESDIL